MAPVSTAIQKVSGGVPCDASEVGKFSYEIKNDQLLITKIEDACKVRGAVVHRPERPASVVSAS